MGVCGKSPKIRPPKKIRGRIFVNDKYAGQIRFLRRSRFHHFCVGLHKGFLFPCLTPPTAYAVGFQST